jgi:hypothetical protein
MVIAADGQPQAALQAPPLEHDASIGRGHALAKAMHAHAPANLGLIRTFCCHSLPSKIIIKTPNSGCSAGVFDGLIPLTGGGRVAIITHAGGFGQTSWVSFP